MHRHPRLGPQSSGPERSRARSAEPIGTIQVVKLAHGLRIDITSNLPDGPARHPPEHYPTQALADQFARMMSQATGFTIITGEAA